jgi:hypothetical protein
MDTLHAKNGYLYIIGCLMRPGVLTFATDLEYHHYPPDTDLNDAYNIYRITYAEAPFYIIEIPSKDYKIAEQVAAIMNLKLQNGKPYNALAGEFRLACDSHSCFSLETLDHTAMPDDASKALRCEYEIVCKKIKSNVEDQR